MGGTGKTQLAAALARSLWGSGGVDLLAWVPAASRDSVITGYAQAQAATGALEGGAAGTADTPEADADSFLVWLADTGRPWLVVLDDLADLATWTSYGPGARRAGSWLRPGCPPPRWARPAAGSGNRRVQPARGTELPDRGT